LLQKKIDGFWAHWNTFAGGTLQFSNFNRLYRNTFLYNVSLGRVTYISGARVVLTAIGSFCSIGPDALIGGLGKHPTSYLSTHPAFYSNKQQSGISFLRNDQDFEESPQTIVGHDVWVGARSIILDGVTVGDGAVVAANAVVTKDVPPYAIVGGIPAKVIRYRFDESVINQLTEWKWWLLPNIVIEKLAVDFASNKLWTEKEVKKLSETSKQLLNEVGVIKTN